MLSSKDGSKQRAYAKALEEKGMACLRFDFAGCGESDGRIEDVTLSRRLDDLADALAWARGQGFARFSLVGSSLGAAVALLAAGGMARELRSLVLMAAVSRPGAIVKLFPEAQVARWKAEGAFELDGVKIRWAFVDDASAHDIPAAARAVPCPTLLMHGGRDELIPPQSSREIYDAVDREKELVILEDADHAFTRADHQERIVDLGVSWILRWTA
jgi:putative redox protein